MDMKSLQGQACTHESEESEQEINQKVIKSRSLLSEYETSLSVCSCLRSWLSVDWTGRLTGADPIGAENITLSSRNKDGV